MREVAREVEERIMWWMIWYWWGVLNAQDGDMSLETERDDDWRISEWMDISAMYELLEIKPHRYAKFSWYYLPFLR